MNNTLSVTRERERLDEHDKQGTKMREAKRGKGKKDTYAMKRDALAAMSGVSSAWGRVFSHLSRPVCVCVCSPGREG